MTADYAALEARVSELEHQLRNTLPYRFDALAYGLSLVHEDVRAFREETRATLAGHGQRFDAIDQRLDSHGEMLAEILRRLPDGGGK